MKSKDSDSNSNKYEFALNLLKEGQPDLTIDQALEVSATLDRASSDFLSRWLNKPNSKITLDFYLNMVREGKYVDDRITFALNLLKEGQPNLTIAQAIEVANTLRTAPTFNSKLRFFNEWILRITLKFEDLEKFINDARKSQHDNFIYDINSLVEIISLLRPRPVLTELLQLTTNTYPQIEASQIDFLIACCKERLINKNEINVDSLSLGYNALTAYLEDLHNQEHIRDFLENLAQIGINEFTILNLSAKRLQSRYESLSEVLQKISFNENKEPLDLREFLLLDGYYMIKNLIGEENIEQVTLPELFAYFEVKEDIRSLRRYLKPKIMDLIKINFRLPTNNAYISTNEMAQLEAFFAAKLNAPTASALCGYLITKKPRIPVGLKSIEIDFSDTSFFDHQLNYQRSLENLKKYDFHAEDRRWEEILDVHNNIEDDMKDEARRREEVNAKFNIFINKVNPASEEIINIFADLFNNPQFARGLSESNEADKFCDFYNAKKNEIVFLLSTKNGLQKLVSCVTTLGHGCVHNISTQLNNALYDHFIASPTDRILYTTFMDSVVYPLDHKHKLSIFDDGADDVFINHNITGCLISPMGFFKALQRQFFDDRKPENQGVKRDGIIFLADLIGGPFSSIRAGQQMANPALPDVTIDTIRYLVYEILEEKIGLDKIGQQLNEKAAGFTAFVILNESANPAGSNCEFSADLLRRCDGETSFYKEVYQELRAKINEIMNPAPASTIMNLTNIRVAPEKECEIKISSV